MVIRRQHYSTILNTMLLCHFCQVGFGQYFSPMDFPGITAKEVTDWFNIATGLEKDFASLMHLGEKVFNLKHLINLKLGLDPASDNLPKRFITKKRKQGPAADHLPPVKEMVEDYYRLRGWGVNGKIKAKKLEALGLKDL
jgi:aldehyde:ferredoxin oxidoreductase